MRNASEEKQLIVGTPSIKVIPIFFVLLGLILLCLTATWGWGWDDMATVMYFVSPAVSLAGIVLYVYAGMCSITVTDKRVYGKAAFGSRVDLPFDMISAVGTTAITHGIIVSTSSGSIKFMYIGNAIEIHTVISEILMDRQDASKLAANIVNKDVSNADELKKYKELLDSGIISQDEFDAKKKQLLGL